jgi:EmrB/QacA subfamily drug resistance transporter
VNELTEVIEPLTGPRWLPPGLIAEAARPGRVRNWRHAGWLAVATVCFGAFMGQLDASIVTLAFPALVGQFHTSLAGVQWVSLSYLLTLVALLAPVGRLADALGRKQLYLAGFALFAVASAACGLAPNLPLLVAFRVVQALGAALLQANSVALVTTSVPRTRMRAALGVQAAAQALGLAIGPTLGGVLVQGLGWRWVFFVNVPVGVLGLLAGRFLLPRTRSRTSVSGFDWPGLALLAASSTALLLALSSVSGLDLPGWVSAALVGGGLLLGYAFVRRQVGSAAPLIDLSLLRRPGLAAGLLAALGGYLVLFGPLVLVPVALTGGTGSAVRAGLVITALPAGFGLAAGLGGRLLPIGWSNRTRCVAGAVLCAVALVVLVFLPLEPGPLVAGLAVLGIGLGVFTPPNNALVMGAVPPTAAAVGGGLVNMGRGLGTSLGVAAITLTLHVAGDAAGVPWGFGVLAVVAAGVALVAARTPAG